MAFCSKCGKKLAWWSARHSVKDLPFCLDCGAQAEREASAKAAERIRDAEEQRARDREEELRKEAEEQKRIRVEEEARRKREEERWAKEKEDEDRKKLEEGARKEAEEQERIRAEEKARLEKEEEKARKKAEREACRKAEEEARRKAEEEARLKKEKKARSKAEEEARRKAEEEARLKKEKKARRKANEEYRRKAEEEEEDKARAPMGRCSFCKTALSSANWFQQCEVGDSFGIVEAHKCCDDCFRKMSYHFQSTSWPYSDGYTSLLEQISKVTGAKLTPHREAVKTAWREEESRLAAGRMEKIKALEERIATEPKSWTSHYGLAEYLDKCWSRYADLDHEVCLTYGEREAYAEYWDFRRKACEEYLKAAALGIVHPLYCALAKLRYAILLGQSGWPYLWEPESEYSHIGPIQGLVAKHSMDLIDYSHETSERIRHYAREAEKDLRKYLREYPDNIVALRQLAQALALSGGDVRSERLMAIDVRIEQAEIRRQMSVAPSSHLASPGAPESPYPDNWNELSESVKHRDGHKCTDCGASGVELHVHHVIPLSKGGTNDLDNLTTLCRQCHSMIHPRMGDTP